MALSPTPRVAAVSLRPATPADAPALAAWRSEPSVRRHQPLQEVVVADLRADLARQRPADLYRSRGDRFQWIVLADRQAVGWITLAITSWEQGVAEVGYALTSEAQGRGLMAPALEQLLAELFGQTAIERLEARCSVDNLASQRVLEKVGFVREGLLRGYFELEGRRVDNFLYALLRGDYFAAARMG
ncbi:MAG: GNAT family N-acetyltransferase [Thermoanaerobaculia bacterium]|nr:MAG: GNAT family N-acetyltransferase [Thermoanaerobaculia bacterium]